MSKKRNWAEVDKRIRDRRNDWTAEELAEVEASLKKLPDLAEQAEIIDIAQPSLAKAEEPAEESAAEGDPA